MKFDKMFKIYLHKDRDKVDISIKVSDSFVIGYDLSCSQFEYILANWKNNGGMNIGDYKHEGDWFIQLKKTTAYPESASTSYVRISVSKNKIRNHHRVSYDDMILLEREYFYQKNNVMHWDKIE